MNKILTILHLFVFLHYNYQNKALQLIKTYKLNIRKATETDVDKVWEIFSKVIKTGDTYVFNPNTPKADLKKHWFADYMETYVIEENEQILGAYIIKPNQIDLGSHIANCSYMVNPNSQGKGIGTTPKGFKHSELGFVDTYIMYKDLKKS